jgi:hypothetical protein
LWIELQASDSFHQPTIEIESNFLGTIKGSVKQVEGSETKEQI